MKTTSKILLMALLVAIGFSSSYAQRGGKAVLFKFFDEKYTQGGFDYTYNTKATKIAFDKKDGYKSKTSLSIQLDAKEYSGASICLKTKYFNAEKYRWASALEFMIKGAKGGEIIKVGILDEEETDGKKTQVALTLNKYIKGSGITTKWQKVSIPLSEFSSRGMYYDQGKKAEFPALIDWDKLAEIRFSCDKGVNPTNVDINIDNLQVVKTKKVKAKKEVFWDFVEETIKVDPKIGKVKAGEKTIATLFTDDFSSGGMSSTYGGKTAARVQKTGDSKNKAVFGMYFDDNDWSGINLTAGKSYDLTKYKEKGGLYFWAKGAKGGENGWIGLMDKQGNNIEVQTKTSWNDWGDMKTEWSMFKIPLKKFLDKGLYWDADKQTEIAEDFDWSKVSSIRFSVGKEFNAKKKSANGSIAVYVDQIMIVDKCDWDDPDIYWDSFASKSKDFLLHDFEKEPNALWEPSIGPKSKLKFEVADGKLDGKSLIIKDYLLGDWVDVVADYKKHGKKFPNLNRDWTKHWGITFDISTDKPWQGITVQIGDSGDELFIANTGAPKGRTTVMIPFRSFNKFPYYQPPHAVQNNKFDLDDVCRLDFKPSGEGTRGAFQIDNVKLTNLRKIERKKGPAESSYEIAGDFKTVITEKINPGIHGQNAALWDGDLLKKETIKYVKDIPHNVVRYPGGLRADDDHWEKVMANKDWMIDSDEFLDWCKKTNSTPMITVNFGKGTPEEAARWVKHVNIDLKANVKYWEIGNELYGNWHFSYDKYGADGGHAYGKRAAKFIKAMKAVDPSIEVTFVGVLDGSWNDVVMSYVKDVADGINVHHYPQAYGQENDYALLAAPQSLNGIIPGVREMLKKNGVPGKKYKIWLTEWNSVDFNPGPQMISFTNGLFVADYLGMLATHNIDIANYWDIHNSLTPEGGDYGYLTRTGDPDGDNVPRASYWAFKMAATSLQGTLYKVTTKDEQVTAYLTKNGKTKTLLVINKNKDTKFNTKLDIKGFSGKAEVEVFVEGKNKGMDAPKMSKKTIKEGGTFSFPKYSITKITIK